VESEEDNFIPFSDTRLGLCRKLPSNRNNRMNNGEKSRSYGKLPLYFVHFGR